MLVRICLAPVRVLVCCVKRCVLLFSLILPVVAQAVVYTPGQFGVNASGAATYAIKLAVPPGTAGMEPKLGLAYNSQGGNGLLGMGWSLSGLSAITRCPQTVAQDGVKGGVNFDWNDKYCLDGQRLMAINGGVYGGNGTEYRTELESFSRVISHGVAGSGPAWFEVHTKSGLIMEYGNTAYSQVLAQGKASVRVWALGKISDTEGNYLTVTYAVDAPNGDYYPSRIDYTGNAKTGLATYDSVQFFYAIRPDITPLYQAGSLIKNMVRLSEVQTYVGTTLVKDYKLGYDQGTATQRSRLTSLTECDGATPQACLQATKFAWIGGVDTLTPQSWIDTGQSYATATGPTVYRRGEPMTMDNPGLISLDINGDGKTDLVQQWNNSGTLWLLPYLSNGTGFAPQAWINTGQGFSSTTMEPGPGLIAMDVNGDGKTDLVQQWSNGGTLYLLPYLSNGTGFAPQVWMNTGAGFDSMGAGVGPGLIAMDVNGDGRMDLVQQWNNAGTLWLLLYLSNGTGFAPPSLINTGQGYMSAGGGPGLIAMDINGDGKTDLVQQWNNGGTLYLLPYLSNGTGFAPQVWMNTGAGFDSMGAGAGPGLIAMDINGDGKTDLVQQWNNGGTLYLLPYLSNGTGLAPQVWINTGAGFASGAEGRPGLIAMDINGDGRMDLVQQWNNAGTLWLLPYLSNGTGFAPPSLINTGQNFTSGYQASVVAANAVIPGPNLLAMDVNGDGKADLVQQGRGYTLKLLAYVSGAPFPDLLSTITTGLGATTTVTYRPLTDNSVYTKGSGAIYPQMDFQGPLYVVSQVSSSDGVGRNYGLIYEYGGAKVDLSGRGFLGFYSAASYDSQSGIYAVTVYLQDFPCTGLASWSQKNGGGVLLNSVSNTYQWGVSGAVMPLGNPCWGAPGAGSVISVVLTHSAESSYELNGGALVTTVTTDNAYDAYANPTSIVVTGAGYSKTTTNVYLNDATNWFLGRLTRSTVTSTTP